MNSLQILGVRIDAVSKSEAIQAVGNFLDSKTQNFVFTPNPEMLVEAERDSYFKQVLNSSSLNICDGKGIQLVSPKKIERIPGVNFVFNICQLASQRGERVFLLGSGFKDVIEGARESLLERFPTLNIVGVHKGIDIVKSSDFQISYSAEENKKLLVEINAASPSILFVAFGHGKQEKWIFENSKHLYSLRVVMGVGGSFEYISGKIKRAPKIFQKLGIEWIWRLCREPRRLGRIWNATVVFLYKYFVYAAK